MTTRRKRIALRAYDYMAGTKIVTDALAAVGETTKLDPTEKSMVDHAVEIAAEQGFSSALAVESMQAVAAYIIKTRGETLFPVFDDRDNMGDETLGVKDASSAVAA